MKALRFANGRLDIKDIAIPESPSEALVRVIRSGICNTDIEIVRGYAGFEGTIGHEFVGIVEKADDADLVGKRVVGEINAGCGKCVGCLAGDPRHCPERTVLGIIGRDGAHAEFLNLPSQNLLVIPDNVSDNEAVFAEPLAAAVGITEQVEISAGSRVAVIGDGKLGLLCAMALDRVAPGVTLVGKHLTKLKIAEKAGVSVLLDGDTAPQINGTFDVVVEASGAESGFSTALDLVRPRGKIVLKSTFNGTPAWAASKVVVDEITIIGSRCGRFAAALKLLSERAIDVAALVDDVVPLHRGVEAMALATERGRLKVLLDPGT